MHRCFDLIGAETVIVVSGVLRIRESLSEAADLLYQKIQRWCSILRRSNSARNRAIITTTAENRIIGSERYGSQKRADRNPDNTDNSIRYVENLPG